MCTYETIVNEIDARAKVSGRWQRINRVSTYVDHPVDYPALHSVCIDFLDAEDSRATGVELSAEDARALAQSILELLSRVPPGVLG
jgi:hypothetical protein